MSLNIQQTQCESMLSCCCQKNDEELAVWRSHRKWQLPMLIESLLYGRHYARCSHIDYSFHFYSDSSKCHYSPRERNRSLVTKMRQGRGYAIVFMKCRVLSCLIYPRCGLIWHKTRVTMRAVDNLKNWNWKVIFEGLSHGRAKTMDTEWAENRSTTNQSAIQLLWYYPCVRYQLPLSCPLS